MNGIDVLLITHTRADYLELTLPQLLQTLPANTRLWVWQNQEDPAVSAVIARHREHPRFHVHHVSHRNEAIKGPTRWFWSHAEGDLVGKVDDDCLVPDGWIERFEQAHRDAPELGIVACWHFQPEDLFDGSVERRATALPGGHTILRNCWVGGSAYLMKRECVAPLPADEDRSFTGVCIDIAAAGYVVGWYHPLYVQDHMDDPRSPNTMLRTDADLLERMPLSVSRVPEMTIASWQEMILDSARIVQTASLDPRDHRGMRAKARRWTTKGRQQLHRVSADVRRRFRA